MIMNRAGMPFIVNVNLSKVLRDEENVNFTMLVDDTIMTIVYELIEWIRWLFSVRDCIYLVHNNSVIHDLEDIRILAELKVLDVKRCTSTGCIHKKFYKHLLNEIDLYVPFNEAKVPKFFIEKISKINQKLSNNSSNLLNLHERKASENCNLSQELQQDNNLATFGPLSTTCNEDKKAKKNSVTSTTLLLKDVDSLRQRETIGSAENTNINEICSNKNIINIRQEDNKKGSANKRNIIKPFSVGEIVAGLRKESEKNIGIANTAIEKVDSAFTTENVTNNFLIHEEETDCTKKKRKRIRKHKSKKKVLEFENDFLPTSTPILHSDINLSHQSEKKSSHIRFSSSSEDDVHEKQNKFSKNVKGDENQFMEFVNNNDKKKITELNTDNDLSKKDFNLSFFSTAPDIENEKDMLTVNGQEMHGENMDQCHTEIDVSNVNTLSGITSFKYKFPHPAIFKRYY